MLVQRSEVFASTLLISNNSRTDHRQNDRSNITEAVAKSSRLGKLTKASIFVRLSASR